MQAHVAAWMTQCACQDVSDGWNDPSRAVCVEVTQVLGLHKYRTEVMEKVQQVWD